MPVGTQILWLVVLAVPVACISWTVTHEDLFREWHEYCVARSRGGHRPWYVRKFFYVFTCEYCFSHYVSALMIGLTRFTLLVDGWRGYLIAWLALVWIASQYMSLHNRLRLVIKSERVEIEAKEEALGAGVAPAPAAPARSWNPASDRQP